MTPGDGPERSELRAQIALAIPLASLQLGFHLMGTVDAVLVGRFSDTALAAVGVGNNLLFAITSIGLGIVMGLDTVISQAVGARRIDDARRFLHAGLRLAVLVGLASTLVVIATPLLLDVAEVPADVAAEARVYVYLRAIGVVPFLLSVALRSYLGARSVTRPLILAVVVGNIANAALDLVMIFGVDAIGLPPLGVAGAAIATVAVQFAIVAVYFASARALDGGEPRPASTRADLGQIVRYGGPVGGQLFAEIGIFGVATLLAANLGKIPAAAHTIALTISSFTFSAAVGIGAATAIRVGHAIGASDIALARQRGLIGFGLGVGVMAGFALLFVAIPGHIVRMFSDDPAVLAVAVPLFMVAALFQLSDGAQAIGAGALRGLGDTRATLIGNVIGHYGIGLGISLTCAYTLGLGVVGLWIGLSVGLTVTALYLVSRFLAGTAAR